MSNHISISVNCDRDSRKLAANSFKPGDRIRHMRSLQGGEFAGINDSTILAVLEVWVIWDSISGVKLPVSCNPLDLELIPEADELISDTDVMNNFFSSVATVSRDEFVAVQNPQSDDSDAFKVGDRVIVRSVRRQNLSHWVGKNGVVTDKQNNILSVRVGGEEKKILKIRASGVERVMRLEELTSENSPFEQKDEMMVENLLDTVLATPAQTATPNIGPHRSNMDHSSAGAATDGCEYSSFTPNDATDAEATSEQDNSVVEKLSELTQDELLDRQRLEQVVEESFYRAGCALRELRDRKLYRSTHRVFETYCNQRFSYNHSYCRYLIKAADIVDNLKNSTNSGAFLPTRETQVRPLSSLEPDEQPKVWQDAVERAGNKVPPARLVKQAVLRHKGIVEDIKKKKTPPCSDTYQAGQVFEICAKSGPFKKFDGCWAIAKAVNTFTLEVEVFSEVLSPVMPENLTPIDSPQECREITAIAKRVRRLRESGLLDRFAYNVLEHLGKQTYLLDSEEEHLALLEKRYFPNNET